MRDSVPQRPPRRRRARPRSGAVSRQERLDSTRRRRSASAPASAAERSHAAADSASAVRAACSSARPASRAARSAGPVVTTTLALTYLNPHVYLDTVLMLGNLANQHGRLRWWFAAGAALGSIVWFTGLGFGARRLAGTLARPATWRLLDAAIGVVMLGVALKLALG